MSRKTSNNPSMSSATNDEDRQEGDDEEEDRDESDDEMPPLLEEARGDDNSSGDEEESDEETADETDDDDTESDVRVTLLVGDAARLLPLQILHFKEEDCGTGNHTIDTVQQQPDRRGWTLGNREMNDQYLRYEAGGDNFVARIISQYLVP
ncbi:predicted protein [Chaetoceros tenuissimus]|uniref:Uncharacterized protein n=1 Tax=Chaetoceros tenuissimus TaxID=426638 RepID=A0AAD3CR68_9STRA|nr:predicted protein [Chaetoceros tenuissimus]